MNDGIRKPTWMAPFKHPIAPQARIASTTPNQPRSRVLPLFRTSRLIRTAPIARTPFDRQVDTAQHDDEGHPQGQHQRNRG